MILKSIPVNVNVSSNIEYDKKQYRGITYENGTFVLIQLERDFINKHILKVSCNMAESIKNYSRRQSGNFTIEIRELDFYMIGDEIFDKWPDNRIIQRYLDTILEYIKIKEFAKKPYSTITKTQKEMVERELERHMLSNDVTLPNYYKSYDSIEEIIQDPDNLIFFNNTKKLAENIIVSAYEK